MFELSIPTFVSLGPKIILRSIHVYQMFQICAMYGISILIAYVYMPPLNAHVDVSRWARNVELNFLCFHTLESEPCPDLESFSEGVQIR